MHPILFHALLFLGFPRINTRWYYETIIQDGFINEVREGDPSAMWRKGQDVDPHFQTVTKLDGKVSMIKVLKNDEVEAMDRKIGNTVFKIAAAATGRYQPLDVGPIFRLLHEEMFNSSADKESDFYKEVEGLFQTAKNDKVLLTKNRELLRKIIGII